VCGSDDKTYDNECELECAGAKLKDKGPCEEPCMCPAIHDPVCGMDGTTYGNECKLKCVDVEVWHPGPCEEEKKQQKLIQEGDEDTAEVERGDCMCPEIYAPVCGSDDKTYDNECELECAGAKLKDKGPCEEPCMCPAIHDPVCGMDGTTYGNECKLKCVDVEVRHPGPCKQQ